MHAPVHVARAVSGVERLRRRRRRCVEIGSGQDPDPVIVGLIRVAYVKRPLQVDDNGDLVQGDLRELLTFDVGADLYVRDTRFAVGAREQRHRGHRSVSSATCAAWTFTTTAAGWSSRCAARFIQGADDDEQPTWNIWEYVVATQDLHRVIPSDIVAEEGQDIDPHYLPDGRIVFSSTRQRQSGAILLDEGKPQFAAQDEDRNEPAFVLHVMSGTAATFIRSLSIQSHDLDPTC